MERRLGPLLVPPARFFCRSFWSGSLSQWPWPSNPVPVRDKEPTCLVLARWGGLAGRMAGRRAGSWRAGGNGWMGGWIARMRLPGCPCWRGCLCLGAALPCQCHAIAMPGHAAMPPAPPPAQNELVPKMPTPFIPLACCLPAARQFAPTATTNRPVAALHFISSLCAAVR